MNGPHITVTWAVPLEAQLLGARLEAYVESKAAIRTFRLCIQYAHANQALAKVPVEVVEMVVSQIQENTFDWRKKWWQDAIRCCSIACSCGHNKEHDKRVDSLLSKVKLSSKVGLRWQNIEKDKFDKCKQVHNWSETKYLNILKTS